MNTSIIPVKLCVTKSRMNYVFFLRVHCEWVTSCRGDSEWHPLKKGWPAGRGRWLSPSTQLLWGPTWSTASRPGAPSTGRMWSSWSGSRGGPLRWSEGWDTSPLMKGWRIWACLAWRREVSGETSLWPFSTWREHINRRGTSCLRGWMTVGQGGMVFNWDRGGLGWILGGSFSPRGWWHTGTVQSCARSGVFCSDFPINPHGVSLLGREWRGALWSCLLSLLSAAGLCWQRCSWFAFSWEGGKELSRPGSSQTILILQCQYCRECTTWRTCGLWWICISTASNILDCVF